MIGNPSNTLFRSFVRFYTCDFKNAVLAQFYNSKTVFGHLLRLFLFYSRFPCFLKKWFYSKYNIPAVLSYRGIVSARNFFFVGLIGGLDHQRSIPFLWRNGVGNKLSVVAYISLTNAL